MVLRLKVALRLDDAVSRRLRLTGCHSATRSASPSFCDSEKFVWEPVHACGIVGLVSYRLSVPTGQLMETVTESNRPFHNELFEIVGRKRFSQEYLKSSSGNEV